MAESKIEIRSALLNVIEELSEDRIGEVLDFALFLKSKQYESMPIARESANVDYPLKNTVIRYDDPYDPVADADC